MAHKHCSRSTSNDLQKTFESIQSGWGRLGRHRRSFLVQGLNIERACQGIGNFSCPHCSVRNDRFSLLCIGQCTTIVCTRCTNTRSLHSMLLGIHNQHLCNQSNRYDTFRTGLPLRCTGIHPNQRRSISRRTTRIPKESDLPVPISTLWISHS